METMTQHNLEKLYGLPGMPLIVMEEMIGYGCSYVTNNETVTYFTDKLKLLELLLLQYTPLHLQNNKYYHNM